MTKFIINGGKKLSGELVVKGAKNFTLKLLPAALLFRDQVVIKNASKVEDISCLIDILRKIGCRVKHCKTDEIHVDPLTKFGGQLPAELVCKLRASLVLTGPLLARFGRVSLPHPGGCLIGKRPIDFFVSGFRKMGARVRIKKGQKRNIYFFSAEKLKGTTIFFPNISVTGTETFIMAAALARGKTVLKNAAVEPEIKGLADFLNSQGARIHGAGTSTITIEGTKLLKGGEATIMPDRIEAGSFAILAVASRSPLQITNCNPSHLESLLAALEKIGVKFNIFRKTLEIFPSKKILPMSLVTHEYPGFPTDLQAPMTVLLTQAGGESFVRETIYENRLAYVDLLNKMGSRIILRDSMSALIKGPTKLFGNAVESPDIRAGIAMVIAGLIAKGQTTIDNIYQIDRGYDRLEERLQKIGADIKRVEF